jgi:hypothetical protein
LGKKKTILGKNNVGAKKNNVGEKNNVFFTLTMFLFALRGKKLG